MAVAVALYGEHHIPPGDIGVVAFVSANTTEAKARLHTIHKILEALGIKHTKRKDDILLEGRPIEFRVYAATVAGVSGFTSILVIADETAKWRDETTGANPAREVLASIRPTMATQPNARIVLSSSPMSTHDEHYRAFELGDSDHQLTAGAPSWVANPTLTEEATHKLEPDVRVWRREYAAIPQSAELGAFDADAVDRAFVSREAYETRAQRVMIIDPSSGRKDAFTYGIAGWDLGPDPYVRDEHGAIRLSRISGEKLINPKIVRVPPILRFDAVGTFGEGTFWETLSGDEVLDKLATIARLHNVRHVHSDQREAFLIKSGVERRGLQFDHHEWSNPSKTKAVAAVRRWLADGTLALPAHETLRSELHSFEEKITASGALTFAARRRGHDDFVSLLLTAAMADEKGGLPSSPYRKQTFRGNLFRPILDF